MSSRSLYPDGVEVHSRHLTYESEQRITDQLQGVTNSTTRGVIAGLAITVNGSVNTKIDVAAGYGYAPNGEYVVLDTSQTGVSLASSTLGVLNYVLLMYDEVNSAPEAHESNGTTQNTKAVVTPRLVVLTSAQYLALPTTDTVLSNNAKDRALLVGIVTGTGGGLTSGAIESPSVFNTVLQTNQPTNITGISIVTVSSDTLVGTGVLDFDISTTSLTWQAPGDGSSGAPVLLTATGLYTITSLGGATLQVAVEFSVLPITDQSDLITVVSLYTQSIPRFSAEDFQHRSKIGSGIPTENNPHGMTIEDLSPGASGSLEVHQDLEHANGIVRTSATSLLSASVNTAPAPDNISLVNFAPGDVVYINGKKIESLASSSTVAFGDGSAEAGTYGIFLNQDTTIFKQLIAQFPSSSSLSDKVQILDVVDMGAGNYNLTWTNAGGGSLSWDLGPSVVATSIDHIIRLYSQNRLGYIDVYIKGGATPGSPQTDLITIPASVTMDEVLPLVNVPWSGSASGFVGYGFGASNSPNGVFDKRLFGTLSIQETREDAGMIDAAQLELDLLGDGLVVRSRTQSGTTNNEVSVSSALADAFVMGALAAGPSITITGGSAYLDGHRLEVVTTTLNLTDNTTNRIYLNASGLIISSTLSWANIIAGQLNDPILRLYEEVISGGSETSRVDLREYVGHKRDAAMGVVALNVNKQATIGATSGVSLTITGSGSSASQPSLSVVGGTNSGKAADFIGGTPNGYGLTALGTGTGNGIGATGGSSGGTGVTATGGGGNSVGLDALGTGTSAGTYTEGGTTSGPGLIAQGGAPNGDGLQGIAAGTGVGLKGTASSTAGSIGVYGVGAGNNPGVKGSGAGSGAGGTFIGGSSTGVGLTATGGSSGATGITGIGGGGNSIGVNGTGTGTGAGVSGTGGTTGPGGSFSAGTAATGATPQNAAILTNGNLALDGAEPNATVGFTDKLTPINIVKAWAYIYTDGAGNVSITDGFNVTSVSVSTQTVTLTIADNMVDLKYGVVFGGGSAQLGGGIIFPYEKGNLRAVGTIGIGAFALSSGLSPTQVDFSTAQTDFSVWIIGRQ